MAPLSSSKIRTPSFPIRTASSSTLSHFPNRSGGSIRWVFRTRRQGDEIGYGVPCLVAVANEVCGDHPTVNRSQKGARDAAEWRPTRHGAWFAQRVIQVKLEYGLTVDPAERDALEALLAGRGAQLNCVG